MKRFVGVALAAVAMLAVAGEANAAWNGKPGRGFRGPRTEVITTNPGVDLNTLLLLQGLSGGAGLASGGGLSALALPLLLNQQNQTTVVRRGRRF